METVRAVRWRERRVESTSKPPTAVLRLTGTQSSFFPVPLPVWCWSHPQLKDGETQAKNQNKQGSEACTFFSSRCYVFLSHLKRISSYKHGTKNFLFNFSSSG